MSLDRDRLLRRALQANAGFSAVSGIALILGTSWLAGQLGLASGWLVAVVGVGLLAFAALLVQLLRQASIPRAAALTVSGADLAWVLGSLVFVAIDPTGMTTMARWLVLGVADVVLVFAIAQTWGALGRQAPTKQRS